MQSKEQFNLLPLIFLRARNYAKRFEESVKNRFGPSKYEDQKGALSKLLQLETVKDYQREFEKLMNQSNKVKETEARVKATVHKENATTKKKETIKEITDTLTPLQSEVASLEAKREVQTKRALKIDDEEFKKAKSEATRKIRKLAKVYDAWLPPWLASCLVVNQS
ncbi:hypothetical protein Tco_0713255 [Tanacetum coccineum]